MTGSDAGQGGTSVVHLRSLALQVANHALSVIEALDLHRRDAFRILHPEKPTRYAFRVDEVPFSTTLVPEGADRCRFHISANLGAIPYTAQSPDCRSRVVRLLDGCRSLGRKHFVVSARQSLWLISEPQPIDRPTPETVLYETLEFVRQARPYVRMLRPYLEHQPLAA